MVDIVRLTQELKDYWRSYCLLPHYEAPKIAEDKVVAINAALNLPQTRTERMAANAALDGHKVMLRLTAAQRMVWMNMGAGGEELRDARAFLEGELLSAELTPLSDEWRLMPAYRSVVFDSL